MKKLVVCLVFLALCETSSAQKIDNMVSFRNIQSDRYVRVHYENDLFTGSDENYTQGYNIEFVLPVLNKNPINYLFIRPRKSQIRYGLSIEHIGFTPDDIKSAEIQFGDRPFASAIMLRSFAIALDTVHKAKLTSSLSTGVIGPAAFGNEMQTTIHEVTGSVIPRGWKYQVRNDVVLNYEVGYEKQVFRLKNFLVFNANSQAQLGTLFTKARLGLNAAVGWMDSPFDRDKRDFQIYLFAQPMISLVGYDATLQGGLFNATSPYVVSTGGLERFTYQHNYGLVLQSRRLYAEYSQSMITREFASGGVAKWGGVRLGVTF